MRTDLGGSDFAFGLVVQTDGKVVAAGRAGGSGGRFALARYESDGDLDPTFGGDGKVTTNFTNGDDQVDTVAIQADGMIVVGEPPTSAGSLWLVTRRTARSIRPSAETGR